MQRNVLMFFNSMRGEVSREVQEITKNLQESCLRKLSQDSRLALEKFSEVSTKLETTKHLLEKSILENKELKEVIRQKKMRLEVAESLLNEMLKQMQRKINSRKNAAVQVHLVSGKKPFTSINSLRGDDIMMYSKHS